MLRGVLHERAGRRGAAGRHVLPRQPHLDRQDDAGLHQVPGLQQVTADRRRVNNPDASFPVFYLFLAVMGLVF